MKNKRYGFTLVEVILTIALIGIVTPVIYSIFFSGQKSFKLGTEEVYEQQDHRLLRDYLTKELRYASYISNGKPNEDPDKLEYEKYYSLELEDGKIVRKEHEKSDDSSDKNPKTLSYFKGTEIYFDFRGDFLIVKYRNQEDNTQEKFTILLENSKLNIKDSSVDGEKILYYAMVQDIEEKEDSTED